MRSSQTTATINQATQPLTGGSHILKLNSNNEYDNSYVFSLYSALGVIGTYVDTWRYAGNGIGIVAYSIGDQGYPALVDLNATTATKVSFLKTRIEAWPVPGLRGER